MLKVGQPAPQFDLPDADMNVISLSSFVGSSNVVIFFYQKDGTPGCTIEAIDFSELQDDFLRHDTVVLGVSMDDCLTHGSFRDKHGLSVSLLADTDGEVCDKYGVIQEKQVDGKGVKRCIVRSTFIIDKRGVVRYALYGVPPRGHADDVLDLIKELT
ncbi:MAG TPA: peroxiredoxin [Burkholderiales bacterium]|nr:peroxiredoxin [Burkholderiales bacterium]